MGRNIDIFIFLCIIKDSLKQSEKKKMKIIPHIEIPAGMMTEKQMAEHDLSMLFNQLFAANEKNTNEKYAKGMDIIETELEKVNDGDIYKGGYFYDTKWLTMKMKGDI